MEGAIAFGQRQLGFAAVSWRCAQRISTGRFKEDIYSDRSGTGFHQTVNGAGIQVTFNRRILLKLIEAIVIDRDNDQFRGDGMRTLQGMDTGEGALQIAIEALEGGGIPQGTEGRQDRKTDACHPNPGQALSGRSSRSGWIVRRGGIG